MSADAQGYIGCAIVLGGVDCRGPSLYNIHPHGSTDTCSYAAMGSGSLNAMAVLEAGEVQHSPSSSAVPSRTEEWSGDSVSRACVFGQASKTA